MFPYGEMGFKHDIGRSEDNRPCCRIAVQYRGLTRPASIGCTRRPCVRQHSSFYHHLRWKEDKFPVAVSICVIACFAASRLIYWVSHGAVASFTISSVSQISKAILHPCCNCLISAACPLKFLSNSASVSASASSRAETLPALPKRHFHRSSWPTSSPPVFPLESSF